MDLPGQQRVGLRDSTRRLRYMPCRPCSNHLRIFTEWLTALANWICDGSATERFFIASNLCGRPIVKI
jgi:hypothetical protein